MFEHYIIIIDHCEIMVQQDVYILIMEIKHIVIISCIKLMILSLFSTNLFTFDMVFGYFLG